MPARRCRGCELDWPDFTIYDVCPGCKKATTRTSFVLSMDKAEAASMARHFNFDAWYERKRDAPRRERGDESPDEAGIRQAHEIMDLEKQAKK